MDLGLGIVEVGLDDWRGLDLGLGIIGEVWACLDGLVLLLFLVYGGDGAIMDGLGV